MTVSPSDRPAAGMVLALIRGGAALTPLFLLALALVVAVAFAAYQLGSASEPVCAQCQHCRERQLDRERRADEARNREERLMTSIRALRGAPSAPPA